MKITEKEAIRVATASSFIEGYKGSSQQVKKEAKKLIKKAYGN